MLKNVTLKAETRTEAPGKVRPLRALGIMPAVIYGQGEAATSLKINLNEFVKVYHVAGESSLINLKIDGAEEIKAIIKSVQKHPVKNSFVHADIYKVNMNEKIEIEIPLNYIGEAKAEKELGGMLMKNLNFVTGSCLPGDLVESIDVDITKLVTFSDSIKISDLELPKGVELLGDPNDQVANVTAPRAEEVEEPKLEVEKPETKDEVLKADKK